MIPLRVFKQMRVLNIAVEVGFVVGITAETTPIGSYNLFVPKEGFSSNTPQVCVFLYLL